jgi:hypothetical protein
LGGTFFAHSSKDLEGWEDLEGNKTELISTIGKLIDEHLTEK